MIYRRDFIKKTFVSSTALLITQLPFTVEAQNTDEYQGILFNGRVDGGGDEFIFLRNLSWQFIQIRSLLGGPFEYENQPFWSSGARTAWDASFSPFLGRN